MATILIILAAFLISNGAATATVKTNMYIDMGLNGKAFKNNIMFVSRARSTLDCAVLCDQQDGCDTFTIDGDVCRGRGMQEMFTSSFREAPGAQSYSKNLAAIKPRDCVEAQPYMNESGVITIYPEGDNIGLQVYCDHDTTSGGWLVFQRRQDGSVNFYRDWNQYQQGFGSMNGEFWRGLDVLHMLTSRQEQELRVDLMKWDGTKGYATYSNFFISDSSDNYRLNLGSFTGGDAGDSLLFFHHGMQFTTWDRDHDTDSGHNCAELYHSAWWYRVCYVSNLNGVYMTNSSDPHLQGIAWEEFAGLGYSFKFAEMKIRAA
ncbi:microfibril-associated glycoprotein 4-like [Littorina saxatilis]|uniref:microfibril-associated glycoprotein 4-like n=1 Tax=Littorina saxatilis TaxID=31220 RepID=UPI0038B64BBB